jgi:hypothetical protein
VPASITRADIAFEPEPCSFTSITGIKIVSCPHMTIKILDVRRLLGNKNKKSEKENIRSILSIAMKNKCNQKVQGMCL